MCVCHVYIHSTLSLTHQESSIPNVCECVIEHSPATNCVFVCVSGYLCVCVCVRASVGIHTCIHMLVSVSDIVSSFSVGHRERFNSDARSCVLSHGKNAPEVCSGENVYALCVYIYICMYICCMYMCMYLSVSVSVSLSLSLYVYICIYMYIDTDTMYIEREVLHRSVETVVPQNACCIGAECVLLQCSV